MKIENRKQKVDYTEGVIYTEEYKYENVNVANTNTTH